MPARVLDLTFIADEQRRVQVADHMALVYDGRPSGGVHWRWDHLCETYDDPTEGRVRKRIASYLSDGHTIVSDDPLTIAGSLLCRSCELHGFVRSGRWMPV
jgi:hypothetical protein